MKGSYVLAEKMFRYQPRGKSMHGRVHEPIAVEYGCGRAGRVGEKETELNSL